MSSIEIFDPAMCCSTGVCGPSVDTDLVRFASDLNWLASIGVSVNRFNLAQQPAAFAQCPEVTELLREQDTSCLPVIRVDGAIVSAGVYPSREQLAQWCDVDLTAKNPLHVTNNDASSDSGCC